MSGTPPYPPSDEAAGTSANPSSVLAPLGAISRAVNEAIGRALALGDPALRDLLIRIGNAVDDVINDLEDAGVCPNYPSTCTGCVQCRAEDEHDGPCVCGCAEDA